ncbi:MAG: hypothetical protein WCS92_03200 [Candidatus Babeliales bacterium]
MNNKNHKCNMLLLAMSCLYFFCCNGQESVNNEQQQVSTLRNTGVVGIDSAIFEKNAEDDLLKSVQKLVIDAKSAGILDEETAKILMAYSILDNVSTQEAQKFLIAAELAGLSNQTRSIDFNSAIAASNKSGSGERLAWICCCSVLVGVICVLIYDKYNYGTLDGLKRDLTNVMHKADRYIRSFAKR